MTTVQIPDELADRYAARARACGLDADLLMQDALAVRLDELDDLDLAQERLAQAQPSLSLEEVKRQLGLDA